MVYENLYTTDCIRTSSGQYVNVFNPAPETIKIEDIAHSLSMQCRFGGHLPYHFSVAQHCINVSRMVKDELALEALLHDASEAYLLDFPRPIKNRMPEYKIIENNLMNVLAVKFGFQYPLNEDVKIADNKSLEEEWEEIFLNGNLSYQWDYMIAKQKFLERFYELTKLKG